MRTVAWWTDWPAGPIRLGTFVLVATALAAVLVGYPRLLRELGDDASRNSALSYADRDVAGGNGVVADQAAVYAARTLIPEDETYKVVVGDDYTGGSDLTEKYVASYFLYFLLPRRQADDASWVVCYGCDLSQYAEADVIWRDDEGISIARVER